MTVRGNVGGTVCYRHSPVCCVFGTWLGVQFVVMTMSLMMTLSLFSH